MAMWDNCAICGRAIPIGEPCYGVKNWRGDPIGGDTICRDCLVLENVPTLTPPNEWVSVEERLPEEKQRVIVRCERVGTSVGWILWGNWMTDIGPGAGKVTHWMPLPKSPKEDE